MMMMMIKARAMMIKDCRRYRQMDACTHTMFASASGRLAHLSLMMDDE